MLSKMGSLVDETNGITTAALPRAPYLGVAGPEPDMADFVLSAILCEQDFVVITAAEGVAVEQLFNVLDRLQQAGLGTATMTAPLARLSLLDDAIRKAMIASRDTSHPLAVIIQHAEMLSVRTLLKLVTLSMLRTGGRPVMRFLLAGTPALWPALREAGLGVLEHDPAAHIVLTPGHDRIAAAAAPLWRGVAAQPHAPVLAAVVAAGEAHRQDRSRLGADRVRRTAGPGRRATVAGLALAVLVSIAVGLAWRVPAASDHGATSTMVEHAPVDRLLLLPDPEPRTVEHRANPSSQPASMAERADASSMLRSARPETPRPQTLQAEKVQAETVQGVESRVPVGRPVPPALAQPPMAVPPAETGLRVKVCYRRGDEAAQAWAMRVLARLRKAGVPADGPVALDQVAEHFTLSYYFGQDEQAARTMARHLLPHSTQIRKLPVPDGVSLPRPGGVSISIGSHDVASDQPA